MRHPVRTNRFKRDVARARKRGKKLSKLRVVMETLISGQPLAKHYRNHPLIGNYAGRYECHIEPDWLLVYKLEDDIIVFERTGAHADLFR